VEVVREKTLDNKKNRRQLKNPWTLKERRPTQSQVKFFRLSDTMRETLGINGLLRFDQNISARISIIAFKNFWLASQINRRCKSFQTLTAGRKLLGRCALQRLQGARAS
jgi:hypothetical protein